MRRNETFSADHGGKKAPRKLDAFVAAMLAFAARENFPRSIAWKLPTPGTGFGSGAGIIMHAVGVRGRIGFGDGDFIRAEGASQGGGLVPGRMEGGALLRQGGTLEFVAEVMKVFRADLHLQDFFDHR